MCLNCVSRFFHSGEALAHVFLEIQVFLSTGNAHNFLLFELRLVGHAHGSAYVSRRDAILFSLSLCLLLFLLGVSYLHLKLFLLLSFVSSNLLDLLVIVVVDVRILRVELVFLNIVLVQGSNMGIKLCIVIDLSFNDS